MTPKKFGTNVLLLLVYVYCKWSVKKPEEIKTRLDFQPMRAWHQYINFFFEFIIGRVDFDGLGLMGHETRLETHIFNIEGSATWPLVHLESFAGC